MPAEDSRYLIAFGSNSGQSEAVFNQVIECFEKLPKCELISVSQPRLTPPVGGPQGQAPYLNAAIQVSSSLTSDQFHQLLVKIESDFGRQRTARWGPRSIDLDLLLHESSILNSQHLVIPHPRMSFRRFVLEPAVEIAGQWHHPVARVTLSNLLDRLDRFPDKMVWITTEKNEVAEVRNRIFEKMRLNMPLANGNLQARRLSVANDQNHHWQIDIVNSKQDFDAIVSEAKFVVWGAPRPTDLENSIFHGPQLDLGTIQLIEKMDLQDRETNLKLAETEVIAAIQATTRFYRI